MTTNVSSTVRRLADRLVAAAFGELVTYDDLSSVIGQDVRGPRVRYMIYQAQDLVGKETGAQFKMIPRQGYQRMQSDELVKIGHHARKRIRNTARKANKGITQGLKTANDLDAGVMNSTLREQSALSLVEHMAQDRHLPKVPDADRRPLTPGQSARQFLDAIGAGKS